MMSSTSSRKRGRANNDEKTNVATHFCLSAPQFYESLLKLATANIRREHVTNGIGHDAEVADHEEATLEFTSASVQALRVLHLSFLQIVAARLATSFDDETITSLNPAHIETAFSQLNFQAIMEDAKSSIRRQQQKQEETEQIADSKAVPKRKKARKPTAKQWKDMEAEQEKLLNASKARVAKQS